VRKERNAAELQSFELLIVRHADVDAAPASIGESDQLARQTVGDLLFELDVLSFTGRQGEREFRCRACCQGCDFHAVA
jgi:hypothetical protein